jgi:hypothetical protein
MRIETQGLKNKVVKTHEPKMYFSPKKKKMKKKKYVQSEHPTAGHPQPL